VNDRDFEFGTALVLGHSKQRKEASPHIKATFGQYPEIGCFWTGEIRGSAPATRAAGALERGKGKP